MDCKFNNELIHKYFDRELDAAEIKFVESHIAECNECKAKLESFNKLVGLIKSVASVSSPGWLAERIVSRLPERTGTVFEWFPIKRIIMPVTAVVIILLLLPLSYFAVTRFVQREIAVTFEIKLDNADTVSLVGDFNEWDVNANPMVKKNGTWVTTAKFKKGKYQYTVIINNRKWYLDPQDERNFNKSAKIQL